MTGVFDAVPSGVSVELPVAAGELQWPDVFVGLEVPLLAPGDGVVTDRHHASASNYEADDAMNQIGGQISPFTLSGWLRHGCERTLIEQGVSVCHPGAADARYQRADVYERDLDAGYHEKGSCVDSDSGPCLVYRLFGGFDQPGSLMRRPIPFSPVRSHVDVAMGQAEAHYRQVNTHVRSRNATDGGQPLRHATRDVVGNVEGTWRLTLREVTPAAVAVLVEAVEYLDRHSDAYELQLGGARNFGAGVVDASVVNPLYSKSEIRCVYDRSRNATAGMDEKDEVWRRECRDEVTRALQAHLAGRGGDVPMPRGDDA